MPNNLNKVTPVADNAPVDVNPSKFFIRSMGRAAQNIDGVNPLLEIIPIENLGYVNGEINVDREVLKASGVDMYGNAFNTKIETSNVMVAEWLSLSANRVSPPSVRRGERVLIWQYADHDKYYWTTCGLDEQLRRLETAIWRYSNTRDEGDVTITPENSYWMEVSTHRKNITLMTSTSDGEQHKYTVQIDTDGSKVTVTDEVDNCFEIDTNESKVSLRNAAKSSVVLLGPDIIITAPGNITMKAGGHVDVTAGENISADAGAAVAIKAAASLTADAGATMSMSAPENISMASGTAVAITAPDNISMDSSGKMSINAPSDISFTAGGNFSVNAPTVGISGSTSLTGTLTSNGKNISDSHSHKDSGGSGTGGPVS